MVRRLTPWEEANPVAYQRQQEQQMQNFHQAQTLLFDTMMLYGRNLDASRQILLQDRSAAKKGISEAFGKWVASLDFFLQVFGDSRRIPKKYQDLYTEVYEVLRPRSHWHQLGAARDPWLAAPYDSTYCGVHIFNIPANNWSGKRRLILNPKEATPGFIKGYNQVYDQLMGNPTIAASAKRIKRLDVN
ncbi:MAG: hypothetical protein R8L07_10590 [Alphaproteobacteria bacterium]|nr:hypothetical protein [Alphaproteobacteria bacterium]